MAKSSTIREEAKAEHESEAEERREHENRAKGGGVSMKVESEGHPGHEGDEHDGEKRGGGVRRPRRARGGSTSKVQQYNAQGSNEAKEAEDESEDFKKGGHVPKKAGGIVQGEAARARGDRSPRGRHAAGGRAGGSVWSSGRTIDAPKDDMAGRGKEGMKVPTESF